MKMSHYYSVFCAKNIDCNEENSKGLEFYGFEIRKKKITGGKRK